MWNLKGLIDNKLYSGQIQQTQISNFFVSFFFPQKIALKFHAKYLWNLYEIQSLSSGKNKGDYKPAQEKCG